MYPILAKDEKHHEFFTSNLRSEKCLFHALLQSHPYFRMSAEGSSWESRKARKSLGTSWHMISTGSHTASSIPSYLVRTWYYFPSFRKSLKDSTKTFTRRVESLLRVGWFYWGLCHSKNECDKHAQRKNTTNTQSEKTPVIRKGPFHLASSLERFGVPSTANRT
jgi:hypothetical protein